MPRSDPRAHRRLSSECENGLSHDLTGLGRCETGTVAKPQHPMALAAVAVVLIACLAGCGAAGSQQPSAIFRSPRCAPDALRLSLTDSISPATGEHGRRFALSNRSRRACLVQGAPRISLFDDARRLRFDYSYEVRHAGELWRSRPVLLRPDGVAYFFVTQFRCEGRSG